MQPLTWYFWSGAVVVPGAGVGSQMLPRAGAGRWSWDICGMKSVVFLQVRPGI
jgi:hypothetical protein